MTHRFSTGGQGAELGCRLCGSPRGAPEHDLPAVDFSPDPTQLVDGKVHVLVSVGRVLGGRQVTGSFVVPEELWPHIERELRFAGPEVTVGEEFADPGADG